MTAIWTCLVVRGGGGDEGQEEVSLWRRGASNADWGGAVRGAL